MKRVNKYIKYFSSHYRSSYRSLSELPESLKEFYKSKTRLLKIIGFIAIPFLIVVQVLKQIKIAINKNIGTTRINKFQYWAKQRLNNTKEIIKNPKQILIGIYYIIVKWVPRTLTSLSLRSVEAINMVFLINWSVFMVLFVLPAIKIGKIIKICYYNTKAGYYRLLYHGVFILGNKLFYTLYAIMVITTTTIAILIVFSIVFYLFKNGYVKSIYMVSPFDYDGGRRASSEIGTVMFEHFKSSWWIIRIVLVYLVLYAVSKPIRFFLRKYILLIIIIAALIISLHFKWIILFTFPFSLIYATIADPKAREAGNFLYKRHKYRQSGMSELTPNPAKSRVKDRIFGGPQYRRANRSSITNFEIINTEKTRTQLQQRFMAHKDSYGVWDSEQVKVTRFPYNEVSEFDCYKNEKGRIRTAAIVPSYVNENAVFAKWIISNRWRYKFTVPNHLIEKIPDLIEEMKTDSKSQKGGSDSGELGATDEEIDIFYDPVMAVHKNHIWTIMTDYKEGRKIMEKSANALRSFEEANPEPILDETQKDVIRRIVDIFSEIITANHEKQEQALNEGRIARRAAEKEKETGIKVDLTKTAEQIAADEFMYPKRKSGENYEKEITDAEDEFFRYMMAKEELEGKEGFVEFEAASLEDDEERETAIRRILTILTGGYRDGTGLTRRTEWDLKGKEEWSKKPFPPSLMEDYDTVRKGGEYYRKKLRVHKRKIIDAFGFQVKAYLNRQTYDELVPLEEQYQYTKNRSHIHQEILKDATSVKSALTPFRNFAYWWRRVHDPRLPYTWKKEDLYYEDKIESLYHNEREKQYPVVKESRDHRDARYTALGIDVPNRDNIVRFGKKRIDINALKVPEEKLNPIDEDEEDEDGNEKQIIKQKPKRWFIPEPEEPADTIEILESQITTDEERMELASVDPDTMPRFEMGYGDESGHWPLQDFEKVTYPKKLGYKLEQIRAVTEPGARSHIAATARRHNWRFHPDLGDLATLETSQDSNADKFNQIYVTKQAKPKYIVPRIMEKDEHPFLSDWEKYMKAVGVHNKPLNTQDFRETFFGNPPFDELMPELKSFDEVEQKRNDRGELFFDYNEESVTPRKKVKRESTKTEQD